MFPVDAMIMAAIVASFALFVTAHISLVFGLAARRPRWRGAVVLVLPPLAPYWGIRSGLRGRSFVWLGALIAYGCALTLGFASGG